jgi:hypothetical protein
MWAGDYGRFRPKIVEIWSLETAHQSAKARNWRAFLQCTRAQSPVDNLRMAESKSGRTFNEINAHSEKLQKFTSISLNRLAGDSELACFYRNRATLCWKSEHP